MQIWREKREDQEALARHLNRIIFCLYAEDSGLLPEGLFTSIMYDNRERPDLSNQSIADLFEKMAGGGMFGSKEIAYFNGDLFRADTPIELSPVALQRLGEACAQNWRSIEPSIFGTLFERALDASKRAQTGAHYTGADDIELVVEPVVMTPLRREWETARQEVNDLIDEDDGDAARARLEAFRERLASVKVLDPACGSGNFLYIALRSLLDLEREAIDFAAVQGWHGLTPRVQPDQMLGLEINHYAAELARTALWIGYIQWHQANGFPYTQRPILTPLDTIRQTDAILDLTDPTTRRNRSGRRRSSSWATRRFWDTFPFRPKRWATTTWMRFTAVRESDTQLSDLCCYWFEKARAQIESTKRDAAGRPAGDAGDTVPVQPAGAERIKETGDIFVAISTKIGCWKVQQCTSRSICCLTMAATLTDH